MISLANEVGCIVVSEIAAFRILIATIRPLPVVVQSLESVVNEEMEQKTRYLSVQAKALPVSTVL